MKLDENVVLALDCHNWFTDSTSGVPFWLGSNDEVSRKICSKATLDFMKVINSKYNDLNHTWTDWVVGSTIQGGIANEWVAQGKRGVIQEAVWSVDGDLEKGQKMNIELLANTLKTFINHTNI